jgi:hypothetical protein
MRLKLKTNLKAKASKLTRSRAFHFTCLSPEGFCEISK